MSSVINKEIVLEAINKLRSRKARPDALRISRYIAKKYHISKHVTKDYLQELSADGSVIKVEYKGSVSYRNPAFFNRLSYTRPIEDIEAGVIQEIFCAIAELACANLEYFEFGVPAKILFNKIDPQTRKQITRNNFKSILDHEVRFGNLTKLDNGNYYLGECNTVDEIDLPNTKPNILKPKSSVRLATSPCKSQEMSAPSKVSPVEKEVEVKIEMVEPKIEENSNDTESLETPKTDSDLSQSQPEKPKKRRHNSVDTNFPKSKTPIPSTRGSSRKRIQKVVFDPSEAYIKKEKGSAATTTSPNKKSSVPSTKKSKLSPGGVEEIREEISIKKEEDEHNKNNCFICKNILSSSRSVQCSHCQSRVHDKCFPRPNMNFKKIKWYCNSCSVCVVCDSNKQGLLLACNLCDDSFHTNCVRIKSPKATQEEWFCKKCSKCFDEEKDETDSEFSSESATRDEEEDKVKIKKEDIETIPDCSNWNCQEVYNYCVNYIPAESAQIFIDQDIDGATLLLLKRDDVVYGFKLKMGPALRVYTLVRKLQTKKDTIDVAWE